MIIWVIFLSILVLETQDVVTIAPFQTCQLQATEAHLKVLDTQFENGGRIEGDSVHLQKVGLQHVISREWEIISFHLDELEQIVTLRNDIKCIQIFDSCERKFDVLEINGIGNCLQLSSVFLDSSSINGFAPFIPRGRYFDQVFFTGWGGSVTELLKIFMSINENVLEKETGVLTFEGTGRINEIAAAMKTQGFCLLSVTNSSISTIFHRDCRLHRSRVVKAYVINLRSARDTRLVRFLRQFDGVAFSGFLPVERFDALDGRRHAVVTPSIRRLFKNSPKPFSERAFDDHNFRKGILGCALSHMIIWEEMATDDSMDDLDAYLVFEDDVLIGNNFSEVWSSHWTNSNVRVDPRWGILYLDFLGDVNAYPSSHVWPFVRSFHRMRRLLGGGLHAYLIRKSAAKVLLESSRKFGMQYQLDWFLMMSFTVRQEILAFKFSPPMVTLMENTGKSSTQETYNWGNENLCALLIETHAEHKLQCSSIDFQVEIMFPIEGATVPPDSTLQLNFRFSSNEDINIISLKYPCIQLCFGLEEIKSRTEPKTAQCLFVFDKRNEYILDWEQSLLQAKQNNGRVHIHAAALDLDGNVIPSSRAEKISVFVNFEWIRINQKSHRSADIYITVSNEPSEDSFLGKHGSDIFCIRGYKPCVHLASLPRYLNLSEGLSDIDRFSETRAVLRSLEGGIILDERITFDISPWSTLTVFLEVKADE